MIYQRQDKINAAEWFGLPPDTYFLYRFDDWMTARSRYEEYILKIIHSDHNIYPQSPGKWRVGEMRPFFDAWAKDNGIELPKPYLKQEMES